MLYSFKSLLPHDSHSTQTGLFFEKTNKQAKQNKTNKYKYDNNNNNNNNNSNGKNKFHFPPSVWPVMANASCCFSNLKKKNQDLVLKRFK